MAKKLNIAIVGTGAVGQALAAKLQKDKTENLNLVLICGPEKPKNISVSYDEDVEKAYKSPHVDVVVEALAGAGRAYDVAAAALDSGKHVVTANATLLAGHLNTLLQIAGTKGLQLRCEGAVLGAAPILQTISNSLDTGEVERIYGVLNGPSNYVLMRMREGDSTNEEAAQAAVELGFASENTDLDLSGKDTLYKAAILRTLAFGVKTDIKKITPIGVNSVLADDVSLAFQLGYQIKLLGVVDTHGVKVSPHLVGAEDLLANLDGTLGGVVVETKETGPLMICGKCAGLPAVVSGLMADLKALQKDRKPLTMPRAMPTMVSPNAKIVRHYYVRLSHGGALPENWQIQGQAATDDGNLRAFIVAHHATLKEMENQLGRKDCLLLEVLKPNFGII